MTTNETTLRRILAANAALSGLTAAIGLVFAGDVADVLGAGDATIVRIVSAGLALWALDVLLLSRAPRSWLRRYVGVVIAGDLAWVAATIGLIAAGAFDPAGIALATAAGAAVAALAAGQWVSSRPQRSVMIP